VDWDAGVKNRRHIFPNRLAMIIFLGYILVFLLVSGLLFQLNQMAVQSLATAVQLEALNFAAMALMGMVLFFIGKLVFELKFVYFMIRLEDDLKMIFKDRNRRLEFRQRSPFPFFLDQFNPMLDTLNLTRDEAEALREKIIETLKKEKQHSGKSSEAISSLADEIRDFTHGKHITDQG